MPVMEGYVYADTPHEKTAKKIGEAYSCHSRVRGDVPIGGGEGYESQLGWETISDADGLLRQVRVVRRIVVEPTMYCGHDFSSIDPECAGCTKRRTNHEQASLQQQG